LGWTVLCRLNFATRQKKAMQVTRWLGEAAAAAACQGVVRPDGIGAVKLNGSLQEFFFELDRGQEDFDRLRDKIFDYDEVAISRRMPKLLLFCFHSSRRERLASEVLLTDRLTVATST
jgi:hypothetical protein